MTTQTRIPPTELTGLFGSVVKVAAKRMVGRVPDSMGVLAHHPALMRASMGIGRKIEALDELDANLASYAVMTTAVIPRRSRGTLPMSVSTSGALPSASTAARSCMIFRC